MEVEASGASSSVTAADGAASSSLVEDVGDAISVASQDVIMEKDEGEEEEPWQHPCGAMITIQNVVATVNLRVTIDLKLLALSARNAEYNPQKFAAVIMRVREPRCTALVFSTGKMVVTGAKSEHAARHGARKFAAIVRKVGFAPRFSEFKIQNMVATVDAGFPIRLEGLVYAHAKFASYEPELFPGLIYRLVSPKIVLLIFVSGRIVITGGKSVENLRTAFDKMFPVLNDFKKETAPHARRQTRPKKRKAPKPTVEDEQRPLALPAPEALLSLPAPPTTTATAEEAP